MLQTARKKRSLLDYRDSSTRKFLLFSEYARKKEYLLAKIDKSAQCTFIVIENAENFAQWRSFLYSKESVLHLNLGLTKCFKLILFVSRGEVRFLNYWKSQSSRKFEKSKAWKKFKKGLASPALLNCCSLCSFQLFVMIFIIVQCRKCLNWINRKCT